ncbi:FAD-binding protein, partial [Chloroflexota bacterium]
DQWQDWFMLTNQVLRMWEKWGIPTKYKGKFEFAGHGFPGKQLDYLKYQGEMQKPILTEQTIERGAEIYNRVMIYDLLVDKNGAVVGAIGVHTREPKMVVFEAKAVILGTGGVARLWPAPTPTCDYNRAFPGTVTGDGRAMAYRAGAGLTNLELTGRHAGPKYYSRAGQATWVGVLRERSGKPVGPFITKPEKVYGDITVEVHKGIFDEYLYSGKGPIYMDMNGISDEDYEYMIFWLRNEGNMGLLNHIREEGINFKEVAVEFMTFEMAIAGGVEFNAKTETGIKGLYAGGDEFSCAISFAATTGWTAGAEAANHAKSITKPAAKPVSNIDEKKDKLETILKRQDGASWQEVNYTLNQLMQDYCGLIRSEVLFEAGLDNVRRLQKKAENLLMASNPHELFHCLEVINLLQLGELTMTAANDRKETRGLHRRTDYTLTNPILTDKRHVIRSVNGKPASDWVQIQN